ncbi:hypothetical protein ACFOSS_07665 [Pseudaeromonas sharmana]|uniref:Uncharacterized protein n=1 Tax=Pseudaeromonas sharmana TaxID=328412 RepID=A0ABV8CN62_9GAMM
MTSIKVMIDENPSFGYRTVAALQRFNKNTEQRIFQLKGASPSASVLCRVWAEQNGWCSLALVIEVGYLRRPKGQPSW